MLLNLTNIGVHYFKYLDVASARATLHLHAFDHVPIKQEYSHQCASSLVGMTD